MLPPGLQSSFCPQIKLNSQLSSCTLFLVDTCCMRRVRGTLYFMSRTEFFPLKIFATIILILICFPTPFPHPSNLSISLLRSKKKKKTESTSRRGRTHKHRNIDSKCHVSKYYSQEIQKCISIKYTKSNFGTSPNLPACNRTTLGN